jgi:hypothetical protein
MWPAWLLLATLSVYAVSRRHPGVSSAQLTGVDRETRQNFDLALMFRKNGKLLCQSKATNALLRKDAHASYLQSLNIARAIDSKKLDLVRPGMSDHFRGEFLKGMEQVSMQLPESTNELGTALHDWDIWYLDSGLSRSASN